MEANVSSSCCISSGERCDLDNVDLSFPLKPTVEHENMEPYLESGSSSESEEVSSSEILYDSDSSDESVSSITSESESSKLEGRPYVDRRRSLCQD